jgi:hypothetical protein
MEPYVSQQSKSLLVSLPTVSSGINTTSITITTVCGSMLQGMKRLHMHLARAKSSFGDNILRLRCSGHFAVSPHISSLALLTEIGLMTTTESAKAACSSESECHL